MLMFFHLSGKTTMKNEAGFMSRGKWFYKLQDPFRLTPYYPLDTALMSSLLRVSLRTAQRICEGSSRISHGELVYLQVMIFGYIPDAMFARGKWFVRDGHLHTYQDDSFDMSAGDLAELLLIRRNQVALQDDLRAALDRVKELEKLLAQPADTCNVIPFPKPFQHR